MRTFHREDVQAVQRLIHRTIGISYREAYPEEAIAYFKDHHSQARILSDAIEGYTLVLEWYGNLVGTGTLLGPNIRRVFIDLAYQRKGLGKLVMDRLEERVLAKGISTLDLSSSLVSSYFYECLGYAVQKEAYIPVRNKQKLRYFAMDRNLRENPG